MKATKPGLAPMGPSNYTPGGAAGSIRPKGFTESVKLIRLPASQLIDKKTTILNWTLNESTGRKSKAVNLTTAGTYTVFENVDRYRKAILEATQPGRPELPDQYRPDMAGAPVAPAAKKPGMLSRGLSKVGGALSTFGRQFTTNVTKEKLKMNWHQAGKPSDSDQLAAWLTKQGVPQDVVTSVYSKMGIPYTAPVADPQTAEPQTATSTTAKASEFERPINKRFINPATGRPYLPSELRAEREKEIADELSKAQSAGTPTPAATTEPAAANTTPGTLPQPTTTTVGQPSKVTYGKGFEKFMKPTTTTVGQPSKVTYGKGFEKFMKPKTATQFPAFGTAGTQSAYKTGISLPKPTVPSLTSTPAKVKPLAAAPATKVTSGGVTPAERAADEKKVADAAKLAVAETVQQVKHMLESVTTRDDIDKIKKYIDRQFTKHGLINEVAFAQRNHLIERVVYIGAQRRREHARMS
jgi:hypothetical protein